MKELILIWIYGSAMFLVGWIMAKSWGRYEEDVR